MTKNAVRTDIEPSSTPFSLAADRPADDLSPSLAEACAQVRRIIGRNDARDALDRYQIGCIIRDVRNAEDKYGQGGVGKIARTIGRDVDTLYEYANVAETWSQIEVTRLLERKMPSGVPLSFSHLVILSRLRRHRDLLKALTDRALSGISARHLRALVDDELRRGRPLPRKSPAPLSELSKIVRYCNLLADSSQSLHERLSELQSCPPTAELATEVQRAIVASGNVKELCETNSARLEDEYLRICSELQRDELGEPSYAAAAAIPGRPGNGSC